MDEPFKVGCRICGKNDEQLRRGLCNTHYRRFMKKLGELPAKERDAFEKKCIETGWIDAKQRGGRPKERDVFDEIADLVAEGTRQAAEAKERYESTNPPKAEKKTKGRKKSG